ncbi:ParB N-terminal domain-containing protein [Gloeocapsopsis crepidinum LEGE 06123]|uniref:ParB N-terminal domain-containing protein n=1 Tax=Gloeocapsopsis crepidinum LEGE 06123 TaxID=588587 RepID=A0ABR9UYF2_9CHRO|nr:ParB/RepB/Spo0J family partition protein [Gloeocapsopsis crepidinum]MBE9193350.1 ParB N-terminal domain-containing protein [Gloeocapsopsis crepidinum LEGE 06123]
MARPRKRANSASVLEQAMAVADAIHEQDQAAASQSELNRAQRLSLPLAQIRPRAEDTRPLRDSHVQDLAESIGALGLIEPLVVDTEGVLLAGGHRLAAIQLLKETTLEVYQQQFPNDLIPVRIMPFDAEAEPERSLQVELAENEKRVNYSRDQIEQLAERLRSLNYRDIPGRPKEGEKALGPALAVAIGVSARYVRKVLAEQQPDQYKNTRKSVPNFSKLKALRKIEAALEELITLPEAEQPTRAEQSLYKAIPTFLKKVKASLEQESKKK